MAPQRVRSDLVAGQRFGPYELVRPLRPGVLSGRWLARHTLETTNHVVHIFDLAGDRSERRRFLESVEAVASFDDPHALPIEQFSLCTTGRGWVVTPFTGDQDGLLLLTDLVEAKSGRLGLAEVSRVLEQVLRLSESGHAAALCHGVLDARSVLIDRRGAVKIELYGLRARLAGDSPDAERIRDEVRSIAGIAYECLTGVPAEEPMIPIGRLVKKLSKGWRQWFEHALDAARGFANPSEALASLPDLSGKVVGVEAEIKPVRGVVVTRQ